MSTPRQALITGASRGIGRAVARRIARTDTRVALLARDEKALRELADTIESEGGQARAVAVDVTDAEALDATARRLHDDWGPLDLLVNNAGRLGPLGPTWKADAEDWWSDLEVNLKGVFLCCRAFLPAMVEAGRGRVVNFAGGGAVRAVPWMSSYGTGKAALVRLTETLDLELEDTGVRAFVMSPGFVRTDMTERFAETDEGRRYVGFLAERLDEGKDTPPEAAAELVARIHAGDADAMHGRYLHAGKDGDRLDEVFEDAERIRQEDERLLGMKGFTL